MRERDHRRQSALPASPSSISLSLPPPPTPLPLVQHSFVSNPEFYWAYELKKKKLARDREDVLEYTDATHIKRSVINDLHDFFMDGRSGRVKRGLCDNGAGGECWSDDGAGDDDGSTSGSESEDGGEEVADPVEFFYLVELFYLYDPACRASGRLKVYELSDDMLMGITVALWPFARDLVSTPS